MAEPRILFVGNSATYFNDLPEMLKRLVPGLKYGQVTKGGQSLAGHANDPAVRWMITGEGPAQGAYNGVPRFSDGHDFFEDGEGWDLLVLQDRADTIKDWARNEADGSKLLESLNALDTFASWVQIAARKMRRRPSIVLFHRCLFDFNELSNMDATASQVLSARGAQGILQYKAQLATHLGPEVPVRVMPAHEAFCMVHEEGPDVFRQLYAGDCEHPSRMGSYLVALLLFRLVTGQSPLNALDFRPTDDSNRLHADMRLACHEWGSSDAVQRQMFPWCPLPVVDADLAQRLRVWAARTSFNPAQTRKPTKPWSSTLEAFMHPELTDLLNSCLQPYQYSKKSSGVPGRNRVERMQSTGRPSFTPAIALDMKVASTGGSLALPRGSTEPRKMDSKSYVAPPVHRMMTGSCAAAAASPSPLVGTGLQVSGVAQALMTPQQIPCGGVQYYSGVRGLAW